MSTNYIDFKKSKELANERKHHVNNSIGVGFKNASQQTSTYNISKSTHQAKPKSSRITNQVFDHHSTITKSLYQNNILINGNVNKSLPSSSISSTSPLSSSNSNDGLTTTINHKKRANMILFSTQAPQAQASPNEPSTSSDSNNHNSNTNSNNNKYDDNWHFKRSSMSHYQPRYTNMADMAYFDYLPCSSSSVRNQENLAQHSSIFINYPDILENSLNRSINISS